MIMKAKPSFLTFLKINVFAVSVLLITVVSIYSLEEWLEDLDYNSIHLLLTWKQITVSLSRSLSLLFIILPAIGIGLLLSYLVFKIRRLFRVIFYAVLTFGSLSLLLLFAINLKECYGLCLGHAYGRLIGFSMTFVVGLVSTVFVYVNSHLSKKSSVSIPKFATWTRILLLTSILFILAEMPLIIRNFSDGISHQRKLTQTANYPIPTFLPDGIHLIGKRTLGHKLTLTYTCTNASAGFQVHVTPDKYSDNSIANETKKMQNAMQSNPSGNYEYELVSNTEHPTLYTVSAVGRKIHVEKNNYYIELLDNQCLSRKEMEQIGANMKLPNNVK